jgi:hypothetical protein
MTRNAIFMAVAMLFLSGCGGPSEAPDRVTTAGKNESQSVAAASSPSSSFEATIRGAVERDLSGDYVPAGSRYNRYHINMVSKEPEGGGRGVVIAFGRDDTSLPGAGTYTLTSFGGDGFSGSVEIYGEPQRDFEITSGELVITDARDDVIMGRFDLTARETPEEYGDPVEEIRVIGTFRSRPAK